MLLPRLSAPKVCPHSSTESANIVVNIMLQNGTLLENEGDAVDLKTFSEALIKVRLLKPTRKKETRGGFPASRSINSFFIICFSKSTAINVFPDPIHLSAINQRRAMVIDTGIENGNDILRLGPLEKFYLVFSRVIYDGSKILFGD